MDVDVDADADVLVVGGGLQGLVVLRSLTEAGFGCVLVTSGDLGLGQTVHSHGLLDSGTGLVTGETRREVQEHVLPELQRLEVPVAAPQSYLALPQAAIDQLAPAWAAHDHHPRRTEGDLVPGLDLPAPVHQVLAHHVDKRALVQALASGLQDRIVRGTVLRRDQHYELALLGGHRLHVRPRAVVVAAGCGTRRLLTDTLGVTSPLLARLGHVRTHMLCLRAPAGVLPPVGTVLTPALAVVAHQDRHGGSRWYVTPAVAQLDRVTEVPDDAHAEVQHEVVGAAVERLLPIVPVLAEPDPRVEATVFAGYKQDVDGQMTHRVVDVAGVDPLLLVAAPSIFAGAWANAREVVEHVRAHLPAQGPRLRLPDRLPAVDVAVEDERRAGVSWSSWREFIRT